MSNDVILEKAKEMLNNNINSNLYYKVYSFATENINGYIDYFDLKNKSLLTVGSSGDQILNAYYKGCRDITLIDVNPFAKYYINLKIAGVISLTYQEFQEFFCKNLSEKNNKRYNLNLFKKLCLTLKEIDYDSYYFFLYILNNYSCDTITNILINDDQDKIKVIKTINNYLYDEKSFNLLKKTLNDFNFNFKNEDIRNYKSNNKYDNIFLSNLCTIFELDELKKLLIRLKDNNLNKEGKILLAYLWNINYFSEEINLDWIPIYNMATTRGVLKDFITEHYNIQGIYDIAFNENKQSDLVMIYKK